MEMCPPEARGSRAFTNPIFRDLRFNLELHQRPQVVQSSVSSALALPRSHHMGAPSHTLARQDIDAFLVRRLRARRLTIFSRSMLLFTQS